MCRALPLDIKAKLAELDLELSEGECCHFTVKFGSIIGKGLGTVNWLNALFVPEMNGIDSHDSLSSLFQIHLLSAGCCYVSIH